MTCRHFRHLFDAHLDRELSESQTAELHAHLLQCPECQQELSLLRAGVDLISMDARGPRLSADFANRIVAKLPKKRPTVAAQAESANRMSSLFTIRRAAGFAAMAAAIVLVAGLWQQNNPGGNSSDGNGMLALSNGSDANSNEAPIVETRVLGAVQALGGPEVEYLEKYGTDFNNAMRHSQRLLIRAIADAEQDMLKDDAAGESEIDSARFVDELLRPLTELFNPSVRVPPTADDIVRF